MRPSRGSRSSDGCRRFVATLAAVAFGVCLLAWAAAASASVASTGDATQTAATPDSSAAGGTERRGLVVIDLTASTRDPDATQVMAFRAKQVEGGSHPGCEARENAGAHAAVRASTSSPGDALDQLSHLVACATDPGAPIDGRADAARRVLAVARAHRAEGSPRIFSTTGDQVQVVVIDAVSLFSRKGRDTFLARGPEPDVVFTEKARSMQIVSDLRSLARLAAAIVTEPALPREDPLAAYSPEQVVVTPGLWLHPFEQTLTLKRATLTVTAAAGRAPAVQALHGLSEDLATRFLERWDTLQAPGVALACEGGKPLTGEGGGVPFAVLLCAALVDYSPPAAGPPAQGGTNPEPPGSAPPVPEKTAPEIALRVEAIQGLGRLGDTRAIPHLVRLSYAPEPQEVREAALTSLSQFKPAAPARTAPSTDDRAAPKADLLTGPKEHWFLSAAVPLTTASALKPDAKSGQLVLEEEPSAFYVGVNFLVGDLSDDRRTLLENLVVSVLIKASRRPLDSLGATIGLRGQYLSRFGLNLDVLTPFVGWTFTKEAASADGIVSELGSRNAELRFGVALNLDQALKWVGGR